MIRILFSLYRCKNYGFKKEEHTDTPPWIVFRFKNQKDEDVEKIKQAINLYNRKIKWIMKGRKLTLLGWNWTIKPLLLKKYKI